MIACPRPVLFDCRVEKAENCLPMIPSGRAHNDMILADMGLSLDQVIGEAGKRLV
jgi:acetolactate synthase-1/2/3 large subunit